MSLPLKAEISLENIKSNACAVKKLAGKSKFCAVVKSDGYGHGAVEVANALYGVADCFAVSLASEGIKLRIAGIDKPIIILTPVYPETARELIRYDIEIPVSDEREVDMVCKAAKREGKPAKVHIAVNTGMNRLGASEISVVNGVANAVNADKSLILKGAFSHFCNPSDDDFTEYQYGGFLKLINGIKRKNPDIILHIAASGGILKNKKYRLDMVRCGLLLYGYSPLKTSEITVTPAMKVYSKIAAIRSGVLKKHVMYGDFLSEVNDITVLRMGYGDGFFRCGQSENVNNLCMDLCAVKGKLSGECGYVPVMTNAEKTAEELKTIPYEVLIAAARRADRVYI